MQDAAGLFPEVFAHDIAGLRESIRELREVSVNHHESIVEMREGIQELRQSSQELRVASAHQYESIQVLMKATEALVSTAQNHEQRITGLERAS